MYFIIYFKINYINIKILLYYVKYINLNSNIL